MKVKELIERLKEIDWDAEIMLKVYEYNPDIDYWETMEYNKIIPIFVFVMWLRLSGVLFKEMSVAGKRWCIFSSV